MLGRVYREQMYLLGRSSRLLSSRYITGSARHLISCRIALPRSSFWQIPLSRRLASSVTLQDNAVQDSLDVLDAVGATEVQAAEDENDIDLSPTTSGFFLRPYQEAAIEACLDALSQGISRMGVSSPTGSGKTTMFMKLIPRIVEGDVRERPPRRAIGEDGKQARAQTSETPNTPNTPEMCQMGKEDKHGTVTRGNTLILVNGVELARQAEGAARRLLGSDWSIEIEQASRRATGRADV